MNAVNQVDDHIDDLVVTHILKTNPQKLGSYIDLEVYEKYRKVLKSSYNRRQQRHELSETLDASTVSAQIQNCKEVQSQHHQQYKEVISDEFITKADKDAVLAFTSGAYLCDMGYNRSSMKRSGVYRPQSLKKRRVMSALGASTSMNEQILKQAIMLHKELNVPSCDFACKQGPYSNIKDTSKNAVSQYVDADICFENSKTPMRSSLQASTQVPKKRASSQAASNDNKARRKQTDLKVDPMISQYSQNLFRSDREKQNYIKEKVLFSPETSKFTLNLDHLLNQKQSAAVDTTFNTDQQKIKFLEEMTQLLNKCDEFYKKSLHFQLCNCSLITAFFALHLKEFILAMKIYSICAEMLMKHHQFRLALTLYTKLLNAAYSLEAPHSHYVEFKLYAFKQLAFCYMMLKEYDLALKTLKKGLQLAWVVNSYTAETNIYDKMAICYFYKADLKRSSYYNNRFLRGVSEANFSRVRKICVIQSKDLTGYLESPPRDFHGIKSLFSQVIKNYALDKPSLQFMLNEINQFTKNDEAFATTIMDPGNQLLKQQSPIQSPVAREQDAQKKRGLPSPSTVNSDKNALLLSNLQILKRKEYEMRQAFLDKAKTDARAKLIKDVGAEQAGQVPDADLLKHEADLYQMEQIAVFVEEENAAQLRAGPLVAMHFQKIRNKLIESDLKNAYQVNDLRSKQEKEELKRKAMSIDLRDVKERAQRFTTKRPCDKISLGHTSIKSKRRAVKKQEGKTAFQIENDFLSFQDELSREKQNVYLSDEGVKQLQLGDVNKNKMISSTDVASKYYSVSQKVVISEEVEQE